MLAPKRALGLAMAVVSVIVPAFNPGPFLASTLKSLVDQDFTDWEAVVVDDGSVEDLSWVAQLDPRLRYFRQPNRGLSAARNIGISETTAPFVAFLDADDIWLAPKLTLQLDALVGRPDAALVSTRFTLIDGHGQALGDGFEGYHDSYEALLQGCGIGLSTVVVRRAVLDKVGLFDNTLRTVQDWDLWLRISQMAPIFRLEEVLALYRIHPASMSQDWRQTRTEARIVLRRHTNALAESGLARVDELACQQAFGAARVALRQNRSLEAAKALMFICRHQPSLLTQALRRCLPR